MIGQVFNELTVISQGESLRYPKSTFKRWVCRCTCGKHTLVTTGALRSGATKSCGHWKKTHGMSGTPTWNSWFGMRQRCYRVTGPKYHLYGGRGIKVCDRWNESFENFLEDMGERTKELSLDRIDPDGDYEPSNCRWADAMTQRHNRRK